MQAERLRPWFGTWPPKLKEGEVNMKTRTWWERWKITVIMVFILLVGAIMLLVCHLYLQELGEWEFVLHNIAIALLIAGILGVTIDRLFRQQLADDAFRASIGYLLPNELKGELEWIYKCHVICIEHIQRVEITPIDDETCTVYVKTQRKFRNVSANVSFTQLGLRIDEWFHKTGSSQIVSAGYIKEGKNFPEDGRDIVKRMDEQASISIEERKISLAPGEEVDAWYELKEIKRTNDTQCWNFAYPTLNPMVSVRTPEGIGFHVDFGYRIESQRLGNDTYRLAGTLLPGQVISIRWWRVADVNKWLGEGGNSK